MAEAIIAGVLERQLVPSGSIIASHPREDRRRALAEKYGIQVTADNADAARRGDVVVLGIKPQVMAGVLKEIRGSLAPDKLLISIIAGATTQSLRHGLDHRALVRDMLTSPGGTSAAAFYELERGRLRTVLADAVWAAYRRTMSLSESLSAGKDPEPMPPRSES